MVASQEASEAGLEVQREGSSLLAAGQPILSNLPADTASRAESGGAVLSFRSPTGHASSQDLCLGQLSCQRFLALAKSSLYWMSPMYGASAEEVPRETQFLLLSLPGAEEAFALLLPLIDASGCFRCSLRPPRAGVDVEGSLVLRVESGDDAVTAESWEGALLVCAGLDPFELVERGVAAAGRLSGGARPSREKEMPPSLDFFGWCTWDAFYSRVSAAGIQEGLQSLLEGGTPARVLIIDDGWQQTDVDPEYRAAAQRSLVSGMGHLESSIAMPLSMAVEEAATDLLAGSDMRQRESLIGLHELEEELISPRPPSQIPSGLPPHGFRSLPASPRRLWGVSPAGSRAAPGALTPRATVAPGHPPAYRGSLTSPRPGLRPFPRSVPAGLLETGGSPRILAARLPPGDSSRVGPPESSAAESRSSLSERGGPPSEGGAWGSRGPSLGSTPRLTLSPHLKGGPYGNPFRRETPTASPSLTPLRASHYCGAVPHLGKPGPPPPAPEELAKQLQEAAAVVVQGVPPLKTSPSANAEAAAALGVLAAGAATAAAAEASKEEGEEGTEEGGLVPPKPTLWGRLLGLLQSAEVWVLHRVRSFLAEATSDSWRMGLFSALATSPLLRGSILRFYATATDHTRRLQSVKANSKFAHPEAGPEHMLSSCEGEDGLKAVVDHLKQQYGVRFIYCWHAMMGFWAGVAPGAPATAQYQPRLVFPKPTPSILEIDPSYSWVQPVLAGVGLVDNPAPLHRDMHAFLKDCGVDGVKVDVQGVVGLAGSAAGGAAALSGSYHASLEDSVAAHFPGNHCINCMCGSTEDLYRMRDTNLARVSDDYYPHVPASWTTHIAHCALNSLFCGELVVPDWDMARL